MEKEQLLKDPTVQPTSEIIAEGLKSANTAFIKFVDGLKQYGITLMDWRFYNDGKAWLSKGEYKWTTPRGANKVKPLFWLSIWEGFFKVSFFFSEKIRADLMNLPITEGAKEKIEYAETMGKTMRFIPIVFDISDDKLIGDLYILAQFRKEKL